MLTKSIYHKNSRILLLEALKGQFKHIWNIMTLNRAIYQAEYIGIIYIRQRGGKTFASIYWTQFSTDLVGLSFLM